MLPETNTRRQEGKYPTIKVLQGCILKLLLHSVNSVAILGRTGNMQSAILLSFVASSSLPPCELQSTHPQMPYYISPYVVYKVNGKYQKQNFTRETKNMKDLFFDELLCMYWVNILKKLLFLQGVSCKFCNNAAKMVKKIAKNSNK